MSNKVQASGSTGQDAIEKFIKRYNEAISTNSKEVRMNIQEATLLAASLHTIMSRNTTLYEQIIALQDGLVQIQKDFLDKAQDQKIEVKIGGGKF